MAAMFTDLRGVTSYFLVKLPTFLRNVLPPPPLHGARFDTLNMAAHSSETSIISVSTTRCHFAT